MSSYYEQYPGKRFLEIFPGTLSWLIIIAPIVLSYIRPEWVAVFMILFDFYWLIKALYMGAHVSLTGLRGMAAPFVGIYLFQSGYFGPDGIWLIGLSGVGLVISAFGFLRMKGDAV